MLTRCWIFGDALCFYFLWVVCFYFSLGNADALQNDGFMGKRVSMLEKSKNLVHSGSDMSLRTKLTISFMLMVFIPVLLVAIVSGRAFYNSYLHDVERQNISVAAMKAKNVESVLTMTKDALASMAMEDAFISMDAERITPILQDYAKKHPEIQNIAVSGLDGMQIARDSGKLFSIADRPYFQELVKGKDYFYNDAMISKATGEISFAESVPIKNNGQLVGVLYVTVRLKIVDDILQYSVDEDSKSQIQYLTDSKGNVMIHPNSAYTSTLTNWADVAPVASAMSGKVANLEYVNPDGDDCMGASAPVEGIGWSVVVESKRSDAMEPIFSLMFMIAGMCAVMLVIAFVAAKLLTAKIVGPLVDMSDKAALVADGDLTTRIDIDTDDEVGRTAAAFNNMAKKMQDIVKSISAASNEVSSSAGSLTMNAKQSAEAAGNVAETVTQVAEGMNKQADNITAAKGSVDIFFGTIQEMKSTTDKINAASNETAKAAISGQEMMGDAVEKMQNIETSVAKTAETIRILGENSQAIGGIVDTIVAIADQTNLLALNAAIEAARAGDAGRGFAVVAEEVRKLAEESQKAAVEIKEKINSIQSDTNDAINTMEAGRGDVKAGTESINAVGTQFNAIQERIDGVKAQLNVFQEAAESISTAASKIVNSVDKIDEASREAVGHTQTISAAAEEQSASTEEIASASSVLEDLAGKLQDTVKAFKL